MAAGDVSLKNQLKLKEVWKLEKELIRPFMCDIFKNVKEILQQYY